MFEVKKEENRIYSLENRSLKDENLLETQHLQEWLANLQGEDVEKAFGEPLLIIQKNFSGFDETRDELDLLAIDKEGRLVIIENKRDDSGKDVVGQALRYAAYCSTLKKSEIVKIFGEYLRKTKLKEKTISAEEAPTKYLINFRGLSIKTLSANFEATFYADEAICKFLGVDSIEDTELNVGENQRLILVAGKFPKEVTSTVLWLLKRGIQAQCMKTTLFRRNGDLFFDIQQIIPPPEAENYMIRISEKEREEKRTDNSKELYRRFWTQLLEYFQEQEFNLFSNIAPRADHRLWKSANLKGCYYMLVIRKQNVSVEFYIGVGDSPREENEHIYNLLKEHKKEIEDKFGAGLEWEEAPRGENFHIYLTGDFEYHNEEKWENINEWLLENARKMEEAFSPIIPRIRSQPESKKFE